MHVEEGAIELGFDFGQNSCIVCQEGQKRERKHEHHTEVQDYQLTQWT